MKWWALMVWLLAVFGTTTYLVFFKTPGESGWWYVLAFLVAGCWSEVKLEANK